MEPKLSIITVCYQAQKEIERTIRSVLEQTFTDLEYILVDGASRDGTLAVIEGYRQPLTERGIRVHVISEPDEGIYHAMNKGLAQAKGQWTLMLNAGDSLADPLVLADLFGESAWEEDVIYCDAVYRDVYKGKEVFKPFPAKELTEMGRGLPFCHQAAFVRTALLKKFPFESRFPVCADYDQFLRIWLAGGSFRYVSRVAAIFDCGGVSLKKPLETMKQCEEIRRFRNFSGESHTFERKMKALLRNRVKKWTPALFYSRSRGWRWRLPRDMEGRTRFGG